MFEKIIIILISAIIEGGVKYFWVLNYHSHFSK